MEKKPVEMDSVIGVWIGFVVVTFIMVMLSMYIFHRWQWWMVFPIGGVLIGGIVTTGQYFTENRLKTCPKCATQVGMNSAFCKNCRYEFIAKCPECGRNADGEAKYCEYCGSNLREEKKYQPTQEYTPAKIKKASFCANCGHDIHSNVNFCAHCGAEAIH
jgi:predicted amidophosphoribosyltransferase